MKVECFLSFVIGFISFHIMKTHQFIRMAHTLGNHAKTEELSALDGLKAYFRMFKQWFKGNYKPKRRNLFLGVLVILYVISPIDLLPAIILDDAMVVVFALKYFKKELNRFINWEKVQNTTLQFSEAEILHD